jgi:hypothetical protein
MHPHLPRNMGQNLVPIFQFDSKHSIGKGFQDPSFNNDRFLLRHVSPGSHQLKIKNLTCKTIKLFRALRFILPSSICTDHGPLTFGHCL